MAFNGRQVLLVGAQAALDQARNSPPRRRPRLPAGLAILIGAGTVTAWRLLARSRGREVLGALEDRLLEYEERHFGLAEPEDEADLEDEEDEPADEDEDVYEDEDVEDDEDEDEDEDVDET